MKPHKCVICATQVGHRCCLSEKKVNKIRVLNIDIFNFYERRFCLSISSFFFVVKDFLVLIQFSSCDQNSCDTNSVLVV